MIIIVSSRCFSSPSLYKMPVAGMARQTKPWETLEVLSILSILSDSGFLINQTWGFPWFYQDPWGFFFKQTWQGHGLMVAGCAGVHSKPILQRASARIAFRRCKIWSTWQTARSSSLRDCGETHGAHRPHSPSWDLWLSNVPNSSHSIPSLGLDSPFWGRSWRPHVTKPVGTLVDGSMGWTWLD